MSSGCASISLVIRAASVDSSTFRLFCGGLYLTLITVLSVRFLSRLEALTYRSYYNLQCNSRTFILGLTLTRPLDLTLKSVISVRCWPSARCVNAAIVYVKWMEIQRQLRRNTPEGSWSLPPSWMLRAVQLEKELRTGAVVGTSKDKVPKERELTSVSVTVFLRLSF